MLLTYIRAHTQPEFRIWSSGFVFHYFLINPRWESNTFQKPRKASISPAAFPNLIPKLLQELLNREYIQKKVNLTYNLKILLSLAH